MTTLTAAFARLIVDLYAVEALASLPRPYPDEPVLMLARPSGVQ